MTYLPDLDDFREWHQAALDAEAALPLPPAHPSAPYPGLALRLFVESVDADEEARFEPCLCLWLEGGGWSDYLADIIPDDLHDGCHDTEWEASMLVRLKRGPGRVFISHDNTLPEDTPTLTLSFPSLFVKNQLGGHCGLRSTLVAKKPNTAPYEVELEALAIEEVQLVFDSAADYHRAYWAPAHHVHMPAAVRERAKFLLLVGKVVCAQHALPKSVWLRNVMPEALTAVQVVRAPQLTDDSDDCPDESEDGASDSDGSSNESEDGAAW